MAATLTLAGAHRGGSMATNTLRFALSPLRVRVSDLQWERAEAAAALWAEANHEATADATDAVALARTTDFLIASTDSPITQQALVLAKEPEVTGAGLLVASQEHPSLGGTILGIGAVLDRSSVTEREEAKALFDKIVQLSGPARASSINIRQFPLNPPQVISVRSTLYKELGQKVIPLIAPPTTRRKAAASQGLFLSVHKPTAKSLPLHVEHRAGRSRRAMMSLSRRTRSVIAFLPDTPDEPWLYVALGSTGAGIELPESPTIQILEALEEEDRAREAAARAAALAASQRRIFVTD